MAAFEPKQVQKELEGGRLWPVYWLYGSERMKSSELLKRIRKAVIGESGARFGDEILEGSEIRGSDIVDSARSLTLGGGLRFIIVRDAHAVKDADALSELFAPPGKRDEVPYVCVFLSKELDRRKKLSKL